MKPDSPHNSLPFALRVSPEKPSDLPQGLGKMNRPRDWIMSDERLSQQLNFTDKDLVLYKEPKEGQDQPGVDLRIYTASEPNDTIPGSQIIRILDVDSEGRRKPTGQYYKILVMSPEEIPLGKLRKDEKLAKQANYANAAEMVEDLQQKYSRKRINGRPVFPDGKIPDDTSVSVSFVTQLGKATAYEFTEACKEFYGKVVEDWVGPSKALEERPRQHQPDELVR